MDKKLIFDLGFHHGEDTRYYLYKGYKVVAVDASKDLILKGMENFAQEIAAGQLLLVNAAISDKDCEAVPFYVSENSQWSSMRQEIAERRGLYSKLVTIHSITLSTLMKQHGVPYYCKIDIEGNDILALDSLFECEEKPFYISTETECLGDNDDPKLYTFETLEKLHALGYKRFKLVDQQTLTVLGLTPFYSNKITKTQTPFEDDSLLGASLNFVDVFPESSGPFGTDLKGEWIEYEDAKRLIRYHADEQRKTGNELWSFWCDWHASY